MKNKGFKITAIILALAVSIIAHPFSIVYAATITYKHEGLIGQFRYQIHTVVYDQLQEVIVNGTSYYGQTIVEVDFNAPTEYDGEITITGTTNFTFSNFTIYCFGGRLLEYSGPGGSYGRYKIQFTNTKEFKLIFVSQFAMTGDYYPTMASASISESTSLTSTVNDIDIILGNIYNAISNLSFSEATITDITVTAKNSSLQTTFTESLSNYDSNKYSKTFNSNISIDTISADFISSNYTNANYGVYQFFFFTQDDYNSSFNTESYTISVKDFTGYYRQLTNDQHFDYIFSQSLSDDPLDPKSIYLITLYIPLYIFNNGSNFFIQLYDLNLSEVRQFEFNYIGVVESVPGEVSDNHKDSTVDDINNITDDLNDQIAASNSATSSTEALLDNFNQNMDLTDYNFSISTGDHVTYFKQKLTDIYEIDEFKPFYLIPIILFVLGRILAG